jgi:Zn-dependent metalloprotease
MKHNSFHTVPETPASAAKVESPKRPYVAAVHQLARRIPDVRAVFDHFGHVRTITTDHVDGLFSQPMLGTPVQHAAKFLNVDEIGKALGLRDVELSRGTSTSDPQLGHTVVYQQQIVASNGVRYPVRHGFVHVYMDAAGKVFNLNSSLRRGRRHTDVSGIIGDADAIEAAKKAVGNYEYDGGCRAELVFSGHNGRIDPVYEVVLCANNPRRVVQVLVKAHTGEVVFQTNLLRTAGGDKLKPITVEGARGKGKRRKQTAVAATGNTPVLGKAFLRIPDPNTAITQQIHDVVIESLPDPKVLKNDNFIMYVGSSKTPVRAKADGTFKYDPKDPEFSAVITFFALQAQMELMKKWGMKSNTRPIPVHVEDRSVQDNAYFDPEGYEIHIGVGSGLNRGGLNRYIAFDLGVSWHENGHHIVFLQTPGNDLPGSEGGAMHESVGDVLGDLLMDWHFRLTYAKQLGQTFGVSEVDADPRIIGVYAMPPNGIRKAKNNKKTPQDKTGEVHDDGEISGGAKADLCVALVKQHGVAAGLELFGRTCLAALALMPAHRCTFRDMLNSFITADQRLNGGANRAAIVQAFGDHGITVGKTTGGRNQPIIIVIG